MITKCIGTKHESLIAAHLQDKKRHKSQAHGRIEATHNVGIIFPVNDCILEIAYSTMVSCVDDKRDNNKMHTEEY